jgi:hypothetical protein
MNKGNTAPLVLFPLLGSPPSQIHNHHKQDLWESSALGSPTFPAQNMIHRCHKKAGCSDQQKVMWSSVAPLLDNHQSRGGKELIQLTESKLSLAPPFRSQM